MKQRRSKSSQLRALCTAQNGIALTVLLACVGIAWWLLSLSQIDFSNPQRLVSSIQSLGPLGIVLYIGFLVVAIVVGPIPSTPVTIAAGVVWGPWTAGIYGVVGIYLGSLAAYFIGRTLGRSVVRALLGKVIYLSNHRGEMYLGWLVFVTHLLPFMPYDLISYGAGISGMSFPLYALTCLLGVIPCIFFLTTVGSIFTGGLALGLGLVILFVLMLTVLPWGVKRYNWLGLRDMIRLE